MKQDKPTRTALPRPSAGAAAQFACALFMAIALAPFANAQPQPQAAAAKGAHETGHLSKFEARRIRHLCQDRVNERGLAGAEREAALSRCFFGRSSRRAQRRECAQQGAAKGLEKAALQDFVRACLAEKRPTRDDVGRPQKDDAR